MIFMALLIVFLSPLTTVPLTEPTVALEQRASEPQQQWVAPLGELRHARVTRIGTVADLVLAEDSAGGLTALDPATGQARWFVQLPAPLNFWPVAGDGVISLACGQTMVVVSSTNGTRRFQTSEGSVPCNSPVADSHALYVPTLLGNRVVATSLESGQVAWSYQMAAPITTPAQLVGAVGTRSVLVGCDDGMLRALPAGLAVPEHERWVAHVGRIIDGPVIAGELVLVASADLVLLALDASSGVARWRHLPGEALRCAPVVVGDLVLCSTDTRLFAVHASSGQLAWEQEVHARPLAELNGAVLDVRADGSSEVREASTGAVLVQALPSDVVSNHGMLVQLRGGTEVVGWKLGR